jgi:predicted dinucleotide-binding enzyme
LAAQTGATAVFVTDAARGAELVIVTIPEKSVPLLPKSLFDGVADEVIVVDTGNYYPGFRDGRIEAIWAGPW